MSRELYFYPAFKSEETGKIVPLLKDVNNEPASIMYRSGSFVDLNFFINELPMISRNDFDDSCKDYFVGAYDDLYLASSDKNRNVDDAPTYVYSIKESQLALYGSTHGLISGYALLEEIQTFYVSEDQQEYYHWEMQKPIPAELYAELPTDMQKKYGKFSTIDYYGKEYVCSILYEVLSDLDVPYEWKGDRYILVYYSF